MRWLIFLYPFSEIYCWGVFIEAFSFADALLVCFSSALLGFFIMSLHGRASIEQLQQSLGQGQLPSVRILHRGCLIFAGGLMILPGLIVKAVALLLILPGTRHIFVFWAKFYFAQKIANGSFRFFSQFNAQSFRRPEQGFSTSSSGMKDVYEVQPQSIEHTEVVINGIKDDPGQGSR